MGIFRLPLEQPVAEGWIRAAVFGSKHRGGTHSMVPLAGMGTLLGKLCITRGDRPMLIPGCLRDPGHPAHCVPFLVPLPRDGDSSSEIMQLDFEMENFTSQSVTRRIMWHIDYRGRNPPPDLEKVVTELTVIQRDIRAIVPLAMVSRFLPSA